MTMPVESGRTARAAAPRILVQALAAHRRPLSETTDHIDGSEEAAGCVSEPHTPIPRSGISSGSGCGLDPLSHS